MKKHLLFLLLAASACTSHEEKSTTAVTPPTPPVAVAPAAPVADPTPLATISTAQILDALYGKHRGDSTVYDAGKLIDSSNPDKQTVAKLLTQKVFQRNDSTFCLALTANTFDGAGVDSGWIDAVLLSYERGTWWKVKSKRQALPGGSFGTCNCTAQILPVRTNGGVRYFAFAKLLENHQGEYEFYSALSDDLVGQQNSFLTLQLGNTPCPDPEVFSVDTLKTGLFVRTLDSNNDQVQLVSYESQERNGKCVGGYKRRTFTVPQLLAEIRRPKQMIE